ncbi:hypothetical protein HDU98_001908, partial [Podochytrium sp. JEL0797]
ASLPTSPNQCVGSSVPYSLTVTGVPAANPTNAQDLTMIAFTVTSASGSSGAVTYPGTPQTLSSLLGTGTAVNGTVVIPQSVLTAAGEGVTDAVVQTSVYYASQPADTITASSTTTFSTWTCTPSTPVPGSATVAFTAPKSRICAGDVVPVVITLTGVPTSDAKYGPTIIRVETQPHQELYDTRGPYGNSANVLPPTLLSTAQNGSTVSTTFTIPLGFSGIANFFFKVELNFWGSNSTASGEAANPASFTSFKSGMFAVTDVNTCAASGVTTAAVAPVTTGVATTTVKSGAAAGKVVGVLGAVVFALFF